MGPKLSNRDNKRFTKYRERKREIAATFDTLTPDEKLAYIPTDPQPSEFEIQAFLYAQLIDLGFTVRGEVKSKCGTCVFDLVVYRDGKPYRIVEVKKSKKPKGSKTFRRRTEIVRREQVGRYARFGVPVDLVYSMEGAKAYLEKMALEDTSTKPKSTVIPPR